MNNNAQPPFTEDEANEFIERARRGEQPTNSTEQALSAIGHHYAESPPVPNNELAQMLGTNVVSITSAKPRRGKWAKRGLAVGGVAAVGVMALGGLAAAEVLPPQIQRVVGRTAQRVGVDIAAQPTPPEVVAYINDNNLYLACVDTEATTSQDFSMCIPPDPERLDVPFPFDQRDENVEQYHQAIDSYGVCQIQAAALKGVEEIECLEPDPAEFGLPDPADAQVREMLKAEFTQFNDCVTSGRRDGFDPRKRCYAPDVAKFGLPLPARLNPEAVTKYVEALNAYAQCRQGGTAEQCVLPDPTSFGLVPSSATATPVEQPASPSSPPVGFVAVDSDTVGNVTAYTDSAGSVVFDKGVSPFGSLKEAPPSPVVGIALTPTASGFWLLGANGQVFVFGDALFLGDSLSLPDGSPVGKQPTTSFVEIQSSPSGKGYVIVDANGNKLRFGDA